uniref:Uncharacterized protein n=1 Tax=Timema bartmani TaxID=61472 RepID=A0A7R9F2U4_9NEOP|nr:unnamed protein product [Timema bartmani]
MEISKTLQENIRDIQNQLKLAIRNHQDLFAKNYQSILGLNGNKMRHYLDHCWQNREEVGQFPSPQFTFAHSKFILLPSGLLVKIHLDLGYALFHATLHVQSSWHPNTSRPNRICSGGPIHSWLWSCGSQTQTGPPGYVPVAQSTPGYGLVASKHKLAHQDMFRWPNPPLAMVSWHPNTNWPNRICSGGPIHPWLWSRGIQTQTGPPEYVPVAQATPGYGLVASKHKLAHQDMFRWPNLSLAMMMVPMKRSCCRQQLFRKKKKMEVKDRFKSTK